jgi:phage baseplate assembly protein V
MNNDFEIKELERRVANLVMIGTVVSTRGDGFARVKIGGLETTWLPWGVPRMGNRKDWAAPEPAEQVLVLSRNGDPAQGVIVASLGSDANPNPSDNPRIFKTVFSDGAFVQIDLDTHEMSVGCAGAVSVEAAGNVTVTTAGSLSASAAQSAEVTSPVIKLTGAVTIDGPLVVTGAAALAATTVLGTGLVPGGNQF